jgi:hypothetical protein
MGWTQLPPLPLSSRLLQYRYNVRLWEFELQNDMATADEILILIFFKILVTVYSI